jgi:hypothetical protein
LAYFKIIAVTEDHWGFIRSCFIGWVSSISSVGIVIIEQIIGSIKVHNSVIDCTIIIIAAD